MITDDLISGILERASDPARRYLNAKDDEAGIELPVEEIDRREEEWTRRLLSRTDGADGRPLSEDAIERHLQEWKASRDETRRMIEEQTRAWGLVPPATKTLFETESVFRVSSDPSGAKPLMPPPSPQDWKSLERKLQREVPKDLKRIYSIADGGFGPGFTGLKSVADIGHAYDDLRRRGPDYCGTIPYPAHLLPIASGLLDYHLDMNDGSIVSTNERWVEDGGNPADIYVPAFDSLATMMEDWL